MSDSQPVLHLDFETRSPLDLTKCGVYRYAEHSATAIWLFAYRFGDGPILQWRPGDRTPHALLAHISADGRVAAHNAAFERTIWNSVLRRAESTTCWPRLTVQQMDCTMSRALAIHLPADLDTLAQVLGVIEQKDKEGYVLMRKMAKPRKTLPDGSYLWWDSPENLDRLGAYCEQDVATECAIDARLPPLSAAERLIWELDGVINDRGIAIDVPSVERCVAVLKVAQQRAHARMAALTSGAVQKCTNTGKLVAWLQGRGIPAYSIAKDVHADLLAGACVLDDETAAEVIRLRASAGKSSTAKFDKMLEVKCADGRARGLLRYHRAHTGRWGGDLIQPQNLPSVGEEEDLEDVLGALKMMESV